MEGIFVKVAAQMKHVLETAVIKDYIPNILLSIQLYMLLLLG